MAKVSEKFKEIGDYQELLASAEDRAKGDWEAKFVSDMNNRFEQYKEKTFISEKQLEILNKIAAGNRD